MNQFLSLLAFLTLTLASPKLFRTYLLIVELQQRFTQNFKKFSTISLPAIIKENTLQEELQLFGQMHEENDFLYFKPNPELSSQILLKKENSWSQSIFFVGKQVSNLILEIGVTHNEGVTDYGNQSIAVYLINCEDNEVIIGQRVKHLRFFKAEVTSQLYELRVSFNWKRGQNTSIVDEEPDKHITTMGNKTSTQTDEDSTKTFQKLSLINEESSRIFLRSLQIWDEVQNHHQEHFQNQQKIYLRAFSELILVCFINIVELFLLKRALKIQSIL